MTPVAATVGNYNNHYIILRRVCVSENIGLLGTYSLYVLYYEYFSAFYSHCVGRWVGM